MVPVLPEHTADEVAANVLKQEHLVGLYKLNAVDPERLKANWFQPLNLKRDILVSKFAFKLTHSLKAA
jgi:hypothetical protein